MSNRVEAFRVVLEEEIRRCAIENRNYTIDRSEVEELGGSLGLPPQVATRLFFSFAGKVWAGEIVPAEGPKIDVYGPQQRRIDPDWLSAYFDLPWMQRKGKIPYGDQL